MHRSTAVKLLRQQVKTPSRLIRRCAFHQNFSRLTSAQKHHSHRRQRTITSQLCAQTIIRSFSISPQHAAQPPTADALMENLTDLYSTAKDEFEIAAEETEKKTVYAADDREAAKEAFGVLKEAYEKAVRESDPETAREVQRRTGPRLKELENALKAVEEMAMED